MSGDEMLNITEDGKLDDILKENELVLVDFHAEWCGPCKMIAPKVKELAKENPSIFFCKVDVDEAEETAANLKITAMPTFIAFKSGTEIKRVLGASEDKIKEAIAALLA
ncbi:Thioredoxin [Hondaea fermentalgiana]|uniref:Thioredoxin n=1 Tax=Hondaea fermentalgiana TaxID=2315210 RepID=A0A2R5GG82_9STRA|nr:Thioredoxin [Hondaea fermentalgiana]|eukprot:GBG28778.1 Thioredoxin [Hondaea fermentalgiana]